MNILKRHSVFYLLYLAVWIAAAIHPRYPQDWLLENILVFLAFPLVIWLDTKYRLSATSMSLLLLFGSMHALGSHYTYAGWSISIW